MVGLGAAKLLVSGLYDLPDRSYSSIILLDRAHIFSHRVAKFKCFLVKTLANYLQLVYKRLNSHKEPNCLKQPKKPQKSDLKFTK